MGKRRSQARPEEGTVGERQRKPTAAALDKLIEEAIVDAHDDSEQAYGFFTAVQDNLVVPFRTTVLGVEVTVEGVDMTERDEIVAVCSREGKRQRIRILDLPPSSPPPKGHEWIEAYRKWTGGASSCDAEE